MNKDITTKQQANDIQNSSLKGQGGDKIKVDTNSLVLLNARMSAPRPSSVKDPEESKKLQEARGKDYDVVTHMLRDKKGKPYKEIREVTNIRTNWNTFLDEHSLKFSFAGMRVISVHHMDKVRQEIAKVNDKLRKQAEKIIDKLPEWKQSCIERGNYIESKFPDAAYFAGYGISELWVEFTDGFDISQCMEDIKENAVSKLNGDIQSCIEFLNDYANKEAGKRKRFSEARIKNLVNTAERLNESGIIDSELFEKICDKAVQIGEEFNSKAFKEAKNKIDTGVTDDVSQEDIDNCKKHIEHTTGMFEELSEELQGLV